METCFPITKGVKAFETVGRVFRQTRPFLVKIIVQDQAADGKP